MNNKDTGGPAFPVQRFELGMDAEVPYARPTYTDPGMTLRDWFAGQALAGIASHIQPSIGARMDTENLHEACATYAYGIADAMLKERSK